MGIPTVTICTDAFVALASEESKNLGMPELPLVITAHPLGGESPEAIIARAEGALDQVVSGLTGKSLLEKST